MQPPTSDNPSKKYFSLWKVLLPVLIGITVVALMFWHDARKEDLANVFGAIRFDARTWVFIGVAFLCIFGRDMGLTWRFRALTDHKLPWKSAWEVDMLCEFTSCVTPSAVGGSSLGMVFLNTKGIEFGKATTLMLTTLILDEAFFVIFCPIVAFFTPAKELFASTSGAFSHGMKLTFWLVYAFLFVYTLLLFTGIIWKPRWIQKLMKRLFSLRWLRRWQGKADSLSANMIAASAELRSKPLKFWLEVFGGTALSWTSRYLVVNALFLGFLPQADPYQWVILARQFVLWVVLMVSPTPGGAGLSEWLFSEYYGDIVTSAGLALVLAICWRIVSYYLYLLIGCVIIPGWLKNSIARIKGNKSNTATEAAGAAETTNDNEKQEKQQ